MYLNIKKTDIALYINCWYSKPKIMVNFSTHISYSPFRFINKRRFFGTISYFVGTPVNCFLLFKVIVLDGHVVLEVLYCISV